MIEDFIKGFQTKETIDLFSCGKCYWFAYILKGRFPHLDICYDPVEGHFFCFDGKKGYDITGSFTPTKYVKWDTYEQIDNSHYKRIVRDCMN